jgi:hypothetical protein
MNRFWNYIKPIFTDLNQEASGKRVLGILSIMVALFLTILTTIVSYYKTIAIAEITMLIAPAYATGLAFWGLTVYQDRKNITNAN